MNEITDIETLVKFFSTERKFVELSFTGSQFFWIRTPLNLVLQDNTAVYGRRDVDRMAVLHDLWTSEARYQDNKMKVGTATESW